jgi:hypothetical protein
MRGAVGAIAAAGLAALLAGCGGQRQDAHEPSGRFRVEVVGASFPARQQIAEPVALRIIVRNDDRQALPDVAVTVETRPASAGQSPLAFGQASKDPRLADTGRPVWVLDSPPRGGETADTNTWALGPLQPGETRTFEWKLVAAHAGTYTVGYRVSPGLNGKARPAGRRTHGAFHVTITDKPVPARVDDNGNVVRGGSGVSASSSGQ